MKFWQFKFWQTFLDPSEYRKVKGLWLATALLIGRFITPEIWVAAFMIFVGGNAYDKWLGKNGNGIDHADKTI